MNRRRRSLARDWRRSRIVVALIVVASLATAYSLAAAALHASGIDPLACFSRGACTVPAGRVALPAAPPAVVQRAPYQPQITVSISHRGVHEVIRIRLAATDPLAQAYIAGRVSLDRLANDVGSVTVDDDDFSDGPLHRTAFSLTASTLEIVLEDDPYAARVAEERGGAHTLTFYAKAPSRAVLALNLTGFRFTNSQAFSTPPDAIGNESSARWAAVPAGSTITVQTLSTSGAPPYGALRTAVENAGDARGRAETLVILLGNCWIPVTLLVLLRGFPRGTSRDIRTFGATLVATATVYAFGTAYLALLRHASPAAGWWLAAATVVAALAFVAVLAVVGIGHAGARVPFAIRAGLLTLGLLVAGVVLQELTLASRTIVLAPALGFAVLVLFTVVALAPRTFARACAANTRLEPIIWGAAVGAVAFAAGASPVPSAVAPDGAVSAFPGKDLGIAVTFVTSTALSLFGFVALVLGRGLDPRAPRALAPWMVDVLLAVTTISINYHVLGIPFATLLALVTIPLVALRPRRERDKLATARVTLPSGDDPSFDLAVLRADVATARGTSRKFTERFVAGELPAAASADGIAQLQSFIDGAEARLAKADPDNLVASFFTSFPFAQPLAAARSAGISGAVVAAVVLSISLPAQLTHGTTPPLYLLAAIVITIGQYVIGASTFALFLPFFRGSIATTKGVMLALAIALAAVPVLWIQMPLRDALTAVAPTVLFYPLIGAIFDALALRKHAAALSVPQLFRLAGLGNFAVIGTVFLTGIVTALTGQLQHAAIQALDNALRISAH